MPNSEMLSAIDAPKSLPNCIRSRVAVGALAAAWLIFGVCLFIYLGYHAVQGVRQVSKQNKIREKKFIEEMKENKEC